MAVATTQAQTGITNRDGHIYIQTGGIEQKTTDLLDSKTAKPLFDAQQEKVEEVERRAAKTAQDILVENQAVLAELKEAATSQLALMAAANSLMEAANNKTDRAFAEAKEIQAKQAAANGGGDATSTGGPAFNPFKATVSSLGGDHLRVMFPKGAELIASPNSKVYQCKFTYLKNGKLDTTQSKMSEMTHADTERTFACVVPMWAEAGKMPEEAEFTTNLEVFENGRLMPAPSGGQVINWVPQTPSFTFAAGLDQKLAGAAGKAKAFAIDFNVEYDYGLDGYKDVMFSVSVGSSFRSIITSAKVTGSADKAERKLEFSLNHPKSAKKDAVYYIDVTIVSKKFKLSTKQRFNIHFKAIGGLAEGSDESVFTDAALDNLKKKIGGKDRLYKLCYSTARDGWSASKFHSGCTGTHDLLQIQKRGRGGYTNRVMGGYFGGKKHRLGQYAGTGGSGYIRGNDRGKAWLFRINPQNKNQVQYAEKAHRSYYVYKNNNYLLTFGAGHDWKCDGNSGSCYTNADYCYDIPGTRYRSSTSMTWLMGTYSWNGKNEKDLIETYIVDESLA